MTEENQSSTKEADSGGTRDSGPNLERSSVNLATPWGGGQSIATTFPLSGPPLFNISPEEREKIQEHLDQQQDKMLEQTFIYRRSKLHETYIIEHEKTKRISIIAGCVLLIAASCILMFAPESRQLVAIVTASALFISAAGTAGFGSAWGKSKLFEFGVGLSEPDRKETTKRVSRGPKEPTSDEQHAAKPVARNSYRLCEKSD